VVKVEGGKYRGFGFVQKNSADLKALHDSIDYFTDNREVRQNINSFLKKNSIEVVEF
jgi:hypothetical protein